MTRRRSLAHSDLSKIPNLYRKLEKRTGNFSFQYKDPRNGKFRGLGADEEIAKNRAKQLNAAIYAQLAANKSDNILNDQTPVKQHGIKFTQWVTEYLAISAERLSTGEIKSNTHRNRSHQAKLLANRFGDIGIKSIEVKHIADLLKTYRDEGKERMAQSLRSVLIDIFAEAVQAGEADHNPARLTKNKSVRIKRARLTFDEWKQILEASSHLQPWVKNSMLIALLTGQRVEDIAIARFKRDSDWDDAFAAFIQKKPYPIQAYPFIEGDYFYVPQQKTRALLKIPLELRLDCLGINLGEAIQRCRSHADSAYLIHHTKRGFKQKTGDPVHKNTVSKGFQRARAKSAITWIGTPPTFHEQRSLSERLYREQGVDTQRLLGHKSAKMTAVYNDSRGAEWLEISIK